MILLPALPIMRVVQVLVFGRYKIMTVQNGDATQHKVFLTMNLLHLLLIVLG